MDCNENTEKNDGDSEVGLGRFKNPKEFLQSIMETNNGILNDNTCASFWPKVHEPNVTEIYLSKYNNLMETNNTLFDRNKELEEENEELKEKLDYFENIEVKNKQLTWELNLLQKRESEYKYQMEEMKCLASDKEDEIINLTQKLCYTAQHNDEKQDQLKSYLGQLKNDILTACGQAANSDVRCKFIRFSEIVKLSLATLTEGASAGDDTCHQKPCATTCDLNTECSIRHNGCGDVKELLCAIEEGCASDEPCEWAKELLFRAKNAIHQLTDNVDTQTRVLCRYETDIKDLVLELQHKAEDMLKMDCETNRMRTDLTNLADELKRVIANSSLMDSDLDRVTRELNAKNSAYEKLLKKTEDLEDELVNMKYCLNMRVEENRTLSKQINEQNQTIDGYIKSKQQMELKLNEIEQKLIDNESRNKQLVMDHLALTARYAELENDLKREKAQNIEKTNEIADLDKKLVHLNNIINGLSSKIQLNEDEIVKLTNEKKALEQRMVCNTDELKSTIKNLKAEIASKKLELGRAKDDLNAERISNVEHKQRIDELLSKMKELEKQLICHKNDNEVLKKKLALAELDLSESKSNAESLSRKLCDASTENDKCRRQSVLLSGDVECRQKTEEKLKKENEELKRKLKVLTGENCKNKCEIDELNELLKCAKKKEICVRKDLIKANDTVEQLGEIIKCMEVEMRCYKKELNVKSEKLTCAEKQVQETKPQNCVDKPLKNKTGKNSCDIKEKCVIAEKNIDQKRNLPTNDDKRNLQEATMGHHDGKPQVKTENRHVPEHCDRDILLKENNRLVGENVRLSKTALELTTEVERLLEMTNSQRDADIAECRLKSGNDVEVKTSSIGVQTTECSINSDNTEPQGCGQTKCDPRTKCPPEESNACLPDTPSCQIDDCGRCSPDPCSAINNDCVTNYLERQKLQCQLDEMKKRMCEQEKAAQKAICDGERRHFQMEMELKATFEKKEASLNAQLESYETNLLYVQRDLRKSQAREKHLCAKIEELNETIKKKEEIIEYEQNNCMNIIDRLNECKKRVEDMKENKAANDKKIAMLEERVDFYMKSCNHERKKVESLEKNLDKTRKVVKRQQNAIGQDAEKSVCAAMRSKGCNDTNKKQIKPTKAIKLRLDLPCCVGAKTPCNRENICKPQAPAAPACKHQVAAQCLQARLEMSEVQPEAGEPQKEGECLCLKNADDYLENQFKRKTSLNRLSVHKYENVDNTRPADDQYNELPFESYQDSDPIYHEMQNSELYGQTKPFKRRSALEENGEIIRRVPSEFISSLRDDLRSKVDKNPYCGQMDCCKNQMN